MEENKIIEPKSSKKVFAILSIVFSLIPLVGIILGIISLLIEKTKSSRIMAAIGIALNIIIPIFIAVILAIGGIFAYFSNEDVWNSMNYEWN